jgi:hypothetical protein
VLGLIGLVFSFVPIIGVVAWPLVILGLALSLIGFSRGRADRVTLSLVGLSGNLNLRLVRHAQRHIAERDDELGPTPVSILVDLGSGAPQLLSDLWTTSRAAAFSQLRVRGSPGRRRDHLE